MWLCGYVVEPLLLQWSFTATRRTSLSCWRIPAAPRELCTWPTPIFSSPQLHFSLSLHAAPAPRTPFTFYNYRHRYPVHGTRYASLFLNPCASVYTQLGQSCSAATRLSLHIPPEQVVVDAAQQKLVKTFRQIWVSCVLLHMSYILDFLL